jgi:GT2 family glycosyltransferase
MTTLACSVVVPTRGGAARLPRVMDSLAAQEMADPWEVVVVLDGDVDDSAAVVTQYAQRLPLRVIRGAGGKGVGAALACGYAEAEGHIILRCDDDLGLRPDFVARHLAHHRSRPEGAAPLGVISLTRDVFDDTPYSKAYGRPANARLRSTAYECPAADRWQHWAACNSVPKAAYLAAGGFDPAFTYREDSELGLRLADSGVEMLIDPLLEVDHHAPAPNAETRASRAFTSGASTSAFDARHPGVNIKPASSGAWSRAVGATASRIASRSDAAALGHKIDMVLPHLPRRAGGKVVALAVEASAVAGRREGDTAWVREH